MTLNRRRIFWLPAVFCLAMLVGCGPEGRETVPVSGTVTLDGTAVADAGVMFTGPEGGNPVATTTDASGNFSLDAVPGSNQVAVSKSKTIGEAPAPSDDGTMPEDTGAPPEVEWIIPMKYANYRTSGLTVDVSKGMEPVRLDLVSGE